MFVLDKESNRIFTIKPKNFSDLGIRERENLQVWLENNPEAFGEELLYIQKEFDGFHDTRERLDLLAIDKQGNIVVIENKLDDSGRDVTWQVLKYASYCSSLSKQQIKEVYQSYLNRIGSNEDSERSISDFLEAEDFAEIQLNQNQRIILVARNYRKEVTSTVLWLLTKYNLKIQCFKAIPYSYNDSVFLNIEQIIPVKEVEEYTIKMAEKAQEEQIDKDELKGRHKLRMQFWKELLGRYTTRNQMFYNISPSKDSWISAGSGLSGVSFNFAVGRNYARTEVYMSRSSAEENKFVFDRLYCQRELFEEKIGSLVWERLDTKKACRIKQELNDVSLYKKEDWKTMMNFIESSMQKMETAFRGPLQVISRELRSVNND
jgi:hypothetical protein